MGKTGRQESYPVKPDDEGRLMPGFPKPTLVKFKCTLCGFMGRMNKPQFKDRDEPIYCPKCKKPSVKIKEE